MRQLTTWIKRIALAIVLVLLACIAAIKALAPSFEDVHGFQQPARFAAPEPYQAATVTGFSDGAGSFVDMGAHHGKLAGGAIIWRSTLASGRLPSGESHKLVFAVPLVADAEVADSDPSGILPVRNERDELIGLALPEDARHQERLEVVVRQPFDAQQPLVPPLIAGRAIQRVTLDGWRYTPHTTSAIERYPGRFVQKGLTDEQIEWCDEGIDRPTRQTGPPIFVRPNRDFFAAGGLAGEVVTEETHRRERLMMLAGGFGVVVLLIGVGVYLLSARARYEEAEAFLSGFGDLADGADGTDEADSRNATGRRHHPA